MDPEFDADSLFEKKFTFISTGIPKLNPAGQFFTSPLWEFVEGSELRAELDETRARLDDKDLITWGRHTSRTDLASFVMPDMRRKNVNIECQLFTRAWCKLMEMLIAFPVIDMKKRKNSNGAINCLFLCEAPGSFIHSVKYYVHSINPKVQFNWMASTLNPYYEQMDLIKTSIGDDRLIQRKETYGNWFFGVDDTGDLLDIDMMKQICCKYTEGKVHLVTCDGGISCIDEPDKQEQLSFPLIFNQFITAINCLKPGGSLILKMFTLFTSQSLTLVYLLVQLFEKVNCFKPVLSKSGNSEIYLVCTKLNRSTTDLITVITSQYFSKLRENCDTLSISSLLDEYEISQFFIQQFFDCSVLFMEHQKEAIIRNLEIYADPNREEIYSSLDRIKKLVSWTYITKRYPINYTDEQLNCGDQYKIRMYNCFKYFHYSLSNIVSSNESYEKRKNSIGTISMESISKVLPNLYQREEVEVIIRKWKKVGEPNFLPKCPMKIGKPYTRITNCRLVDKNLLHLYNLVISTDGKVRKIHEIKCQQALNLSAERTESRLGHLLRPSLKMIETKFNLLIAPESSLIIGPFLKVLNNNQIYPGLLSNLKDYDCASMDNRSIIIIDPFNYNDLNSAGNFLSIVEEEHHLIGLIVDQLIDYLTIAKSNDLLVIHSCSFLSRLMIELIYLLTKLFAQISIVPSFTNHLVEENKNYQLGILILLTNLDKQSTILTEGRKQKIISILSTIKSAYTKALESGRYLLEIFPFIDILPSKLIVFRFFIIIN